MNANHISKTSKEGFQ